MRQDVSEHLLSRLHEWGVRRIYGERGDGVDGLTGALRNLQPKIDFVSTRQVELAALMACGHARFTGEVGVCVATSAAGAIQLLGGLYDARMDNQPVVAILGQQARSALGAEFEQEVDLVSLFGDVASAFVQMATVPEQIRHLVDRAVRTARDQRTVTCIVVPSDLQGLPAVARPPRERAMVHSGVGLPVRRPVPAEAELAAAAAVLNAGKRVAILVGAGALQATDEVVRVAETLGAGVAKALLGKAAVPDDLPFVTGAIGGLGTQPSWMMMNECDTLLVVGSNFPYTEFLPAEGQARGVQIDLDGRRLGLRHPMEVNLAGDAAETLRALLPLLDYKIDRGWRTRIEDQVARWWRLLDGRARQEADPINPQRVFSELSPRLPDHCIVAGDAGPSSFWFARDLKIRRGMMASLSGGLAAVGSALPYALAAKFAHPGRHVVAIVGDGGMQGPGFHALTALASVWRRFGDARLTILVLNSGDPDRSGEAQRPLDADARFERAQAVPAFPCADYARALGLGGIRVDRPEQIGAAWDAAIAADRPTVVEMITDPDVPPVPAHVTPAQIKSYLSAVLHGDADARGMIVASAKEWWEGLFPPRAGSDRPPPKSGR